MINNGNYDFNLSVVQYGSTNAEKNKRKIQITFKKTSSAMIGNISVEVRSPIAFIFSDSYTLSLGEEKTIIVEVPNFGEYKVEVRTSRNALYDYVYTDVRLHGTHTKSHVFTQADHDAWALEDSSYEVFLHFQSLVGGLFNIFVGIAFGLGVAALNIYNRYAPSTEVQELIDEPIVGWKVEVTQWQSGDYLHCRTRVYNTSGTLVAEEDKTTKVKTY